MQENTQNEEQPVTHFSILQIKAILIKMFMHINI